MPLAAAGSCLAPRRATALWRLWRSPCSPWVNLGLGLGLGSGSGLGLGLGLGWAFGFEVRLEAGLFAHLGLLAHLLLFHRLAQLSPELQQV